MTAPAPDRDARLLSLLEHARREQTEPSRVQIDARQADQLAEDVLARVVPSRSYRTRNGSERRLGSARVVSARNAVGAVCAAAALLALAWLPTPAARERLPDYSLHVLSDERGFRGAGSVPRTPANLGASLSLGSELRVTLHPARPHARDVELVVQARDARGVTHRWYPEVERGPSGALQARGIVGAELPAAPGRLETLWWVRARVGRLSALPLRLAVTVR